jgi:hypothetical protein
MDIHCDGRYVDSATGYKFVTVALDPEGVKSNWTVPFWVTVFFLLVSLSLLMGLILRSSRWGLPSMGIASFLALGLLLHKLVFPIVLAKPTSDSPKRFELSFTPWFWIMLVVTSFPMSAALKNECSRWHSRSRE